MGTLVNIIGVSGAGKDTFGQMLGERLSRRGELVSFPKYTKPMKKVLGYLYDVDERLLEDRDFRASKVPGSDLTYLDLMVRAFTHFRAIDPYIVIRPTMKEIRSDIKSGYIPILTNLRTPEEVTELAKLSDEGVNIINVLVTRPGVKVLASDVHLCDNWENSSVFAKLCVMVNNDGYPDKMHKWADNLTDYIILSNL